MFLYVIRIALQHNADVFRFTKVGLSVLLQYFGANSETANWICSSAQEWSELPTNRRHENWAQSIAQRISDRTRLQSLLEISFDANNGHLDSLRFEVLTWLIFGDAKVLKIEEIADDYKGNPKILVECEYFSAFTPTCFDVCRL